MPAAAEPLMAVSSTAASTEPPAGVASSSAWAAGKPRSLMTVASSAAPPAAAAAAKAALTSEQHQVGNGKEQEEDAVVLLPDDDECQLCMEPLDEDEVFMPCPCGYAVRVPHCCPLSRVLMSFSLFPFFGARTQICSFCFNKMKEMDRNACPACTKPYLESNITYIRLTPEQ